MPSNASATYYKGPMQCMAAVYRQHGISGCFRGFYAMGVRDVPTFGVYVVVYEYLFHVLSQSRLTDNHGVLSSLVAGGFAGVACWSLIIPVDVVKSQLQADLVKNSGPSKSIWFYVRRTYQQHGVRGFLTGLQVTCVRAFLVNAVTFLFYSLVLRYLDKVYDSRQANCKSLKETGEIEG